MRRRGADESGLPERLLRLQVDDWPDPGPEPWWRAGSSMEDWQLHEARRRWRAARMDWVRRTGRTRAVVDALFGPGYDPASGDERAGVRERRLLERMLLPRSEWTHDAA